LYALATESRIVGIEKQILDFSCLDLRMNGHLEASWGKGGEATAYTHPVLRARDMTTCFGAFRRFY
jgi:hypothetical protein